MKSMRLLGIAVLLAIFTAPVFVQEGETTVVDAVIAQINGDVITLSALRRETQERIEALKQQGRTEQQAAEDVSKEQAELIANLINERLLLQRGNELQMADDIEAEVNRRMLQIAQQQGITTIEKLYAAMRDSGLDPDETRRVMRKEMMKQAVLQQEVDRRVYLGFSAAELKAYFEEHPDRFRRAESVKLSEIYLTTTGKDEAAVRARVLELIAEARAGGDFASLAAANSEREKNGKRSAPEDKGYVGEFDIPSLREDLAAAINGVQAGGVTEPIRADDGYLILRVDARTPGGAQPVFDEGRVRESMLMELQQRERADYLQRLRDEAVINIAETHRASVEPLLNIKAPVAAPRDKNEETK